MRYEGAVQGFPDRKSTDRVTGHQHTVRRLRRSTGPGGRTANRINEPYTPYVPADKKLDPQWVKSLTAKGGRKVYAGAN